MKHNAVLSSEQALDDYFSALLDEEAAELELAQEKDTEVPEEVYQAPELVPKLKPKMALSESLRDEFLPHVSLEGVQRLLNQMEAPVPLVTPEDIVTETEVEGDLADDISAPVELIEDDSLAIQTVTEAEAEVTPAEEIQDWVVEPSVDASSEDMVTEDSVLETSIVDETDAITESAVDTDQSVAVEAATGDKQKLSDWHGVTRSDDFQVLYFDVNGVNFAVPLDELGGIHRVDTLNHLIGKPKWYLGLQTTRDNQLDVVDTARWVMSDKLEGDDYKASYQYIVMLGESNWGLAAGELKGTELLSCEKVRWREHVGKRPWLAGMVKEKMCALIHVEALIAMLNAGLDVKALDNND